DAAASRAPRRYAELGATRRGRNRTPRRRSERYAISSRHALQCVRPTRPDRALRNPHTRRTRPTGRILDALKLMYNVFSSEDHYMLSASSSGPPGLAAVARPVVAV